MMEEPFWLGLLAVFVVLGILGAGYTVKKHLPDKFDRLITEDGQKTQSAKTSNASHVGGLPGMKIAFLQADKLGQEVHFGLFINGNFIDTQRGDL